MHIAELSSWYAIKVEVSCHSAWMFLEATVPLFHSLCSPPGDGCVPQGAKAAPSSGKGCLDHSGIFRRENDLILCASEASDVVKGTYVVDISAH